MGKVLGQKGAYKTLNYSWVHAIIFNIKGKVNMMLIITDKNPYKSADWLINNTNKNFCFKQVLELNKRIKELQATGSE